MKLSTSLIYIILIFLVSSCSRPRVAWEEEPVPIIQERPAPIQRTFPRKSKIVIDAGHGGRDSGAQSLQAPKAQEKQLTLATALMLNSYLKSLGYQTILTRAEDYFIPLDLRSSFANSNNATLFVSVHYNAATNTQAEGIEVYYYKSDNNKERTDQSKSLADKVHTRVIASTNAKSRGVKHGNYSVIRETNMPAILVEGGFITNEKELKNIRNPEYQRKVAQGIAQGINDYLESTGDVINNGAFNNKK